MFHLSGVDSDFASKQAVCSALREFYRKGWVSGTGGGMSLEDAQSGHVVTTPTALPKEMLVPHHLVVLRLLHTDDDPCSHSSSMMDHKEEEESDHQPEQFEVVSLGRDSLGRPLQPSASFPLFAAIHRHIAVRGSCVMHVHSSVSVAVAQMFASKGESYIQVSHLEMIKGIEQCLCSESLNCQIHKKRSNTSLLKVKLLENREHESQLLPQFRELFAEDPCATLAVVKGHGLFVWGVNFDRCKAQLECFEQICQTIIHFHSLGMTLESSCLNTNNIYKNTNMNDTSMIKSEFIRTWRGLSLLSSIKWIHKKHNSDDDETSPQLHLLNQRELPLKFSKIICRNVSEVAECIANMTVRGAPAIGASAGFGMVLALYSDHCSIMNSVNIIDTLMKAKSILDAARPTAVNLSHATNRVLNAVKKAYDTYHESLSVSSLRKIAERTAMQIFDDDLKINETLADYGASLIKDGSTVIHHCNTGSLATVLVGTALGTLFACHAQGKKLKVLIDETRPRLQGSRLTALELQTAGLDCSVVTDSQVAYLMSHHKKKHSGIINCCIVGSDRVAANGDVANKIGTYTLAVCARHFGVPFYVSCPTSTIDLDTLNGDAIEIEHRDSKEVRFCGPKRIFADDIDALNPAFDVTPHDLITAIITEKGICRPPFVESLAKAKREAEMESEKARNEFITEIISSSMVKSDEKGLVSGLKRKFSDMESGETSQLDSDSVPCSTTPSSSSSSKRVKV